MDTTSVITPTEPSTQPTAPNPALRGARNPHVSLVRCGCYTPCALVFWLARYGFRRGLLSVRHLDDVMLERSVEVESFDGASRVAEDVTGKGLKYLPAARWSKLAHCDRTAAFSTPAKKKINQNPCFSL